MIDVSKCLESLRDYRRFGFGMIGGPDKKVAVKDVINVIEGLEDQIRDLTKMVPKWISVDERLPEDQGDHLVLYSFGETNVQCFAGVMYFIRYDERPHFENDGLYGMRVTHWMPLPESPKED